MFRCASHRPPRPALERFGPPEGPPKSRGRAPLPASRLQAATEELSKADAELEMFERASAARREMTQAAPSALASSGGAGAGRGTKTRPQSAPLVRRPSSVAQEQLDEVEAIKRAFAKYGMKAPEAALKR